MLRKAKILAASLTAALAFMYPTAQAATITINVGASQSLANALVDIIGTFQSYYFSLDASVSYNVSVTVDSNDNLKSAVVAGGGAAPYDLILTDDSDLVGDLTKNYSAYLEGVPFIFARDRIDLYSISTDVSKVLTGLPARFAGTVVIPDPATDSYGKAAANLLAELPWLIKTIPNSRVAVQPDVATVRAGVDLGLYPYGILAKSAICTNTSGTDAYPESSYHHEYPPLLGLRYHQIELTGVKTVLPARTADQVVELADFVNFLTGVGTTQGTDVLKRSCYVLPKS